MPRFLLRSPWVAALAVLAAGSVLPVARAADLSAAQASELLREPGKLLLKSGTFDPVQGLPAAPADLELREADLDAARYWIVQVEGPLQRASRERVERVGARILRYLPNSAYLVRASRAEARALEGEPSVRWVGPYRPDFRLSPDIGTVLFLDPDRPVAAGQRLLVVCVFPGEDVDLLAEQARALGADVLSTDDDRDAPWMMVRVDNGGERPLAAIEGVEWIEELGEITLRNNTTRWVAQSNATLQTPVWDAGLHGEDRILGHVDGAIQMASCYFRDQSGNTPGPSHRKVVAYRGTVSTDSHGTHTAGTAAGFNDSGSLSNAGMAYEARISHTRIGLVSGYADAPSDFYDYLELASADGADVHTNSWGDDGRTTYTWWCRDIDRFSHDYEDDLVLFAVTNTSTLKTPENAKNVLAVGATQQSPNQASHGSGGRGPTSDGRRKPEIYLPGIGIVSASTSLCGTATSSGTSMACPAVAGCAILVRQYYETGFHPSGTADPGDALTPSGALVKATLLNGTVDMTGVTGYPSDREGWGRLLLDDALYFPGDARTSVVKDVRNAVGLSTAESDEYVIDVQNGLSLQVTMVFTDPPAAHAAALTPINDLDLEVEGPDGTFLGNVFSSGSSTTGGNADNLNNVERVILPASGFTDGTWTLRVLGTSIPDGPQGYALHVSGLVSEETAVAAPTVASAADPDRMLAQNHPNPFGSSTRIRFALPAANEVTLAVYDIAGRLVRTLAQGPMNAGDYALHWDGRDERGDDVTAGIYFYRLEGTGIDETRKMVLLR